MNAVLNTQKPVLILVHGFRGSPIGLKEIGDSLQQSGYQVFIPPIPPFAGAKKLPEYTPESYASYLKTFVNEHRLQKPILIGHSMGSIVVAAALESYPKLFHNKAVLMSPISKRTAVPFRMIAPLSVLAPKATVDYITTKFLFTPHDKELLKHVLEVTHDCSNDQPPAKSEIMQAAKFSTKYAIGDFNLKQNILLLAGANDRLISQDQTKALAQQLNAKLIFLSNTGHLHNYEQPRETATAILEFIK